MCAARGSSRWSPSPHLAGILTTDGTIDGSLAARTPRIVADGRTYSYVLWAGEPALDHAERRPADPAREGGAPRRLPAADGALRHRAGRPDPARGGLRCADRPRSRPRAGLVPDCDPGRRGSAGNAAGHGARIALLDRGAREEIERVVRAVEKVETAVEPRFQEHFVHAMAIPHDHGPVRAAAGSVPLPTRRSAAGRGRRRRLVDSGPAAAGPECRQRRAS